MRVFTSLRGAAEAIPRGGIFRFEGRTAFHLVDAIAVDAIIGDPDSNRLKCEDGSDKEASQQKSFSEARLFRRTPHVSRNFLWKSAPGQAVSENKRGNTGIDEHPGYSLEMILCRFARAGCFGTCEDCQNPISRARLEAVPWARLCRDCKDRKHG
jgi:hypothetical protein